MISPAANTGAAPPPARRRDNAPGDPASANRGTESGARRALDPDAQRQVAELQRIDRSVRAHEAAHQAAAGGLGGGVSFSYTTGPDGRRYATGGEVPIDTGAERTPQATIAKMARVRAAALAPGDPSPQDLAVAARAGQTEARARAELMQQQRADFDLPQRQTAARKAYAAP